MLLFAPPEPAHATPQPLLWIEVDRTRDRADVMVRNDTGGTICLLENYDVPVRLSARTNGKLIPHRMPFEGRPLPGCRKIAPRGVAVITYKLSSVFQTFPAKAQLCYTLLWKSSVGGQTARVSTTCATA